MGHIRFNLNTGNYCKINAELLYISSSESDGEWQSIPHSHHYTEFFYIQNGSGQFTIENKTFTVQSHDFIVVNPNVKHTEKGLCSSPFSYIVLGVTGLNFSSLNGTDYETHIVYNMHNYNNFHQEFQLYLKTMLREIHGGDKYSDLFCQNLFELLIISLMRESGMTLSAVENQKFNHDASHIKRYIDENYKQNITLDHLSEIAHVNKFYLAHSFSQCYGASPINYLLSRRLKESKYLLTHTDYSISQISQIVGFSSPSYFSQHFLKATSQTPSQFRKQIASQQLET